MTSVEEPVFPEGATADRAVCEALLHVGTTGFVSRVDVRGCDDPFVLSVREAASRWGFEPLQTDHGPEAFVIRAVFGFEQRKKRPRVTWELSDPMEPIRKQPFVYPDALRRLGVGEVDCDLEVVVGSDGQPASYGLDACPAPAHADLRRTLDGWRWAPLGWPDGPTSFRYQLRVKYRMIDPVVPGRPLDAADAWAPPPWPEDAPAPGEILLRSWRDAPPRRKTPLDWSDLRGAIPLAATVCPVVLLVDDHGRPRTADFTGCPEALQAATWDTLSLWRWPPFEPDGVPVWFQVSMPLAFKPPS